ncbi:hypothetical protein B0H11DRAFT_2247740 [Mycena galericulata]|nr:hypothetical protein B0H11DRAFT_2247740 [Mycena galericulata]
MSGRKPLDPATKAEHRQESLRRYAENAPTHAASPSGGGCLVKYRDKHREAIREADTARRARQYIEKAGAEAFDVKKDRKFLARTQRAHEGHPPPPRPRPQNRRPDLLARRGPNRPHALPHSARSAVPQTQVGRRHVSSSPEREQHIAVARPSKRRRTSPSPLPRSSESDSQHDSDADTEAPPPRKKLPTWALPPCRCGTPGCPQCACVCPVATTWTTWMDHECAH